MEVELYDDDNILWMMMPIDLISKRQATLSENNSSSETVNYDVELYSLIKVHIEIATERQWAIVLGGSL